jgi:Terpene cyclase DEP1
MRLRHVYLACCVLGLILPYSQFVPWVMEHGLNPSLFLQNLFVNRISGFFVMDVLVSAIVLITFIRQEASSLQIRHRWIPVVAILLVGVSLGLPLFLYMRQAHLDRVPA